MTGSSSKRSEGSGKMAVLFRIAFRNLKQHKSKTLIVGILIALGVLILIIGNSLLDTASVGIRKSFIENYTGDIMVRAKSDKPLSLIGYTVSTGNEKIRNVPEYSRVYKYLTSLDEIVSLHSQVTGFANLNLDSDDIDMGAILLLFGIEPESYMSTFPENIEMVAGEFLKPGEAGILLMECTIDEIREELEIDLSVGDILTIEGGFGFGVKIREVPLRGVYRLKTANTTLDDLCLIDIQSLRSLSRMIVGTEAEIELGKDETTLLSSSDPDSMFGEEMIFVDQESVVEESEENLNNILGDTSRRFVLTQPDSGAWHYTLIRLHDSDKTAETLVKINNYFQEEGIDAEAVDWLEAAGIMGSFSNGIKVIFNVLVIIISIVSVIIIMNTLIISVIERTSEIGTMRALGAQKKYIRHMFILETMTIAFIFGIIGLILGGYIPCFQLDRFFNPFSLFWESGSSPVFIRFM
jgi:putative ABC transport system permease protein